MVSELGTNYLKEFIKKYDLQDKKILNVGCGKDFYDFLPNAINFDEMDWSKYGVPNFMQGNAENMPFEDEEFDAVILIDVLEHVKHPHLIMKEIGRVLKKDGLLCTINCLFFKIHGDEIPGLVYKDYWRFNPDGINLLCEEAGLNFIEHIYIDMKQEELLIPQTSHLDNKIGLISIPLYVKIHTTAKKK